MCQIDSFLVYWSAGGYLFLFVELDDWRASPVFVVALSWISPSEPHQWAAWTAKTMIKKVIQHDQPVNHLQNWYVNQPKFRVVNEVKTQQKRNFDDWTNSEEQAHEHKADKPTTMMILFTLELLALSRCSYRNILHAISIDQLWWVEAAQTSGASCLSNGRPLHFDGPQSHP